MTSDKLQHFEPQTFVGSLVVTSQTETLNCDISSLENDTEMVDHSINDKFKGAS